MSAVKHTKAKTIHIPVNSKTGKKRRFAIVGFANKEDLASAINRHIYLFGNNTWWSTKDNTKITRAHKHNKREETTKTNRTQKKSAQNHINTNEYIPRHKAKDHKNKGKGKNTTTQTHDPRISLNTNSKDILNQLTQQLYRLNTRIDALEVNKYAKGDIRARPNFS